jgi:hypothetical protein
MLIRLTLAAALTLPFAQAAEATPKNCPPGLAKKAVPCVPPGQAKKGVTYRLGDIITGDYIVIRNPGRYGLDPNETYYRVGDQVVRVDRETREILDLIGAVAAVLN